MWVIKFVYRYKMQCITFHIYLLQYKTYIVSDNGENMYMYLKKRKPVLPDRLCKGADTYGSLFLASHSVCRSFCICVSHLTALDWLRDDTWFCWDAFE